ncbi:Cerberus [Varanus komodoensis]|uniref:cerberus n=1 Tax=Varanus komodoensis TaxID=61221 RepID=UPI001CF7A304|nr:cerberus [Varanus komodoensis]KAF7244649.1 Cerberus [Varanus komodoensis]
MFFLLLQMLLISWVGIAEQGCELREKRGMRTSYLLAQDMLTKYPVDDEGPRAETGLLVPHLLGEMERRNQDNPKMSKTSSPYPDSPAAQDLGNWAPTRVLPYSEATEKTPSHSHSKRETESLFKKDAKKFWDLFMLKTKSRSEEIILPIKTKEMYQEICSTLPFSQSIAHDNCEKLVIQNNLCFGKCSSFHVPGLEDRLYTFCSHCLPTKFSMKRLEMNCTTATPVFKVVRFVEECKCEAQKTTDPERGFLHSNLQAKAYEQD